MNGSKQFPGKPKVEAYQLFDTIAKCRVTFGAWIVCKTELQKRFPNKHLKIVPYQP